MSILLVCNEPYFRVVLGGLLSRQGYEVDVCRDLDGAKVRVKRRGYALVILHLLGEQEGVLSACQELKKIRSNQKVAFIHGRWTSIPQHSCPDYLIPLEADHDKLLAQVGAIVDSEAPQPLCYTWELAHRGPA